MVWAEWDSKFNVRYLAGIKAILTIHRKYDIMYGLLISVTRIRGTIKNPRNIVFLDFLLFSSIIEYNREKLNFQLRSANKNIL